VNPYARELTFLDHATRTRRDHMKYLGVIRTLALLHQYQREVKTVEHRGEQIRYVEATREDIATANRLCAEVLGRSLDELPPQTRRLLGLLDALVTTESQRLGIDREDFRFSRRAVREHTRWGQTQLRIHLGRLVEMEYVAVHRGGRGQGYLYELTWAGECGCPMDLSEPGDECTVPTWRGSEANLAGGVRGAGGSAPANSCQQKRRSKGASVTELAGVAEGTSQERVSGATVVPLKPAAARA
jgi:hypothetical protein